MKIRDYVLTLALVGLLGAVALVVLVGWLTTSMGKDADRLGELSTLADKASEEYLTAHEFIANGRQMLNAMDVLTMQHPGLLMFVEDMIEIGEEAMAKLNESRNLPAELRVRLVECFEQFQIQSQKIGAIAFQDIELSATPPLSSYNKAAEAFASVMNDLEIWAENLIERQKIVLQDERQRVDAWRQDAYYYMSGAGILYLAILGFFAWRTYHVIIAPISRMAFAADASIENDLPFTFETFTETPWTKAKGKGRRIKKKAGPKEIEVLSRLLWELVHGLEETVNARTKQLVDRTFNLEEEIKNRKELELELLHAQKMKAVGQLAAGIAHEIRTPTQYVGDHLLFIEEATQKLLASFPPREGDREDEFIRANLPRAIQSSMKGIERISEIVTSMKRFSYKDQEYDKYPSDLNQAVLDTVAITSHEWKDCVVLETELDPELPEVECQIGEINQVIMNLIINASQAIRDYKKGGMGNITIRTRPAENNQVEIEVEDNGGGMTDEVSSKVFEPFFTTKEVGVGSGQGLAISHSVIVGKHNGELSFETELGRGTTFRIRLPEKAKREEST
ncbi:MAG: ATP-binding protein [Opitutales bacterium]